MEDFTLNFPVSKSFYGIIYKITNLKNGKVYIGQTIQPLNIRWSAHKSDAKSRKEGPLSKDIREYGENNFKIEEIERCYNAKQLDEREKYWIHHYKSNTLEFGLHFGYNKTSGGWSRPKLSGKDHPKYIEIDKDLLKSLIQKGWSAEEMGQEFNIHSFTIYKKIKEFWNITLDKAREYFGSKELSKAREKTKKSEALKGKKGPSYKNIDKYLLKELIIEGFSKKEIAQELNITEHTLGRKIKEFFGKDMTLNIVRKYIKTYVEIDKDLLEKLIKENFTSEEIDKVFLKQLIMKGLESKEIAQKLNIDPSTVITKIREFWGKNLIEMRDFFMKPILKSLIKKGLTAKEISQQFNITITTLSNKIRKFWDMTLIESRESFEGMKLFEARRYKRLSESHKGIFRKEIDIGFLKKLIVEGLTKEEIVQRLKIGRTTLNRKIKEFWDISFSEAREFFKSIE